jgi:hypothetical protein
MKDIRLKILGRLLAGIAGQIAAFAITVPLLMIGPAQSDAKSIPADRCALLPISELQTVLGGSYSQPQKTVATPAYLGLPPGVQCTYSPQGSGDDVTFIIYIDPSASTANQTFHKLQPFYGIKSLAGVGNSAYVDNSGAIHVLKGDARFYINAGSGAKQSQLITLAISVAKQL